MFSTISDMYAISNGNQGFINLTSVGDNAGFRNVKMVVISSD